MSKFESPTVLSWSYEEMLERGLKFVPSEIKVKGSWSVPEPEIIVEGNRTTILNWKQIITVLNRDEKFLLKYLEHRLGTVGWVLKDRAIFQGNYRRYRISKLINLFAKEYVICDVCGSPHTVLIKEKGAWIKKCQACGAWRVVERI
mgnify:CR=1 FL=1